MSNERKIILHAGLHKTGTSTIQNVFHANRQFLLEEEGILYPSLAPNLSTSLSTVFRDAPDRHMFHRMAGRAGKDVTEMQEKYLDSLDDEISSHEWRTLLLSAEGFSHFTESELEKLREWVERYASRWTVIVCVRHPVTLVRSLIQQRLKHGLTLSQQYRDPTGPGYEVKIAPAVSVFGRENVHIYDFDSAAGSDGGIVGAFAERAGLAPSSRDFLASRSMHANESFSMEAAQLLSAMNRERPIFIEDIRNPLRVGPGHEVPYLRRIKGQRFDIPDVVKENIRQKSRKDLTWLNETFGLDLYPDVMDTSLDVEIRDEPLRAMSDPAIESIAEIFGELLTERAFNRALEGGRKDLDRGDLDHAEMMLRRATQLNPDAPKPKQLLRKVSAMRRAESSVDVQKKRPKTFRRLISFSSRLLTGLRQSITR